MIDAILMQRLSDDELKKLTAWTIEKFKANTGRDDIVQFVVDYIAERLRKYPYCYREFGLYWWSIKDLLKRYGYDFGRNTDKSLIKYYSFDSDEELVVMAERFKDYYTANFFKGSNQFIITGREEKPYLLNDSDIDELEK